MHVLVIPSWYPEHEGDVAGSFFREQAIALSAAGVQVGVIAFQRKSIRAWNPTIWRGEENASIDAGVPTYRRWRYNYTRLGGSNAQASQVRRHGMNMFDAYVRRWGRPDIVHVHSLLFAGAIAHEIWQKYRIPYVISEHSTAFARGKVTPLQIDYCREWAQAAAGRFAVSSPFRNLLNRELGRSPGDWAVMANSVNRVFLDASLKPRAAEVVDFLNVSLLTAKKGVDLLIKAFADHFRGNDNVRLTVIGDGPERSALERMAIRLNVGDQISFAGRLNRDQVMARMRAADVVVVSSYVETFGVVAIEAMALGKPVIATRCGGPEDIVQAGTGILVPPSDVGELGRAMREMSLTLGDYDAEAIRESCRQRYSTEVLTREWSEIYERVARK